MADIAYVTAFAEEVGVEVGDVARTSSDDLEAMTMQWSFDTGKPGIPALARQLLPHRVNLTWRQRWPIAGVPIADQAEGSLGVELLGSPKGQSAGAATLQQRGPDVAYIVQTTTKAALPWPLAGQVEKMIDRDLVGWILRTQVEVLEEWQR